MLSRVVKGVAANALGQGVGLLTSFLLPPLFLQGWGVTDYGYWVILASIASYMSVTDLGGQLYVVNRMTQAMTRKDTVELTSLLHTGLALFILLPGLLYVLLCLVIVVGKPADWFELTGLEQNIVLWVLLLLAFRFVISLPQGLILGVYRATGHLPRGVMLGNLMNILLLLFTVLALKSGAGMIQVAAVQIFPALIVGALAVVDLRRRLSWFSIFPLTHVDIPMAKGFVRPSMNFFLMYLAQVFSVQGMVIVVAALFGAVQVVVFSTLRTVSNVLQQAIPIISHSVWPEMTRLDMEGDPEKLRELLRVLLRVSLLFALMLMAALHYYGEDLYLYWLDGELEYDARLMDWLLVYVVQTLFWTLCGNLLMASNRHLILSKVVLANALLTLLFGWIGGEMGGLTGVVIGMVLCGFILPVWAVMVLLKKNWPLIDYSFYLTEMLAVLIAGGLVFLNGAGAIASLMLFLAWSVTSLLAVRRLRGVNDQTVVP